MAQGRDRHQARRSALQRLGKGLTRRAGSRCEICESASPLSPVEVTPLPEEPEMDRAVLVCSDCVALRAAKKLPKNLNDLRFLETTMWSEVPPVQVEVVRLLKRVAAERAAWAEEALDGLWLSEEIQEWIVAG